MPSVSGSLISAGFETPQRTTPRCAASKGLRCGLKHVFPVSRITASHTPDRLDILRIKDGHLLRSGCSFLPVVPHLPPVILDAHPLHPSVDGLTSLCPYSSTPPPISPSQLTVVELVVAVFLL